MRRALTVVLTGAALVLCAAPAQAAPGDLDPSFNGTGKLVLNPGGKAGELNDAVVQPDGKIVLVGSLDNGDPTCPNSSDLAVIRLNPDGSLDSGFAQGGIATLKFPFSAYASYDEFGEGIALQPNGKIVVGGESDGLSGCTAQNSELVAARLNSDGSLDQSFSPGGPEGTGKAAVEDGVDPHDVGDDVAVDGAGRVLIAGRANPGDDFLVTRLTAEGATDTAFNNGSPLVKVDFGGGFDEVSGLGINPDGSAILAGLTNSAGNSDVAVAKVSTDHGIDTTFATGGKLTYGYGSTGDTGSDVAIEPGGKIYVAASGSVANDFALSRLTAGGGIDRAFATSGTVGVDFGGDDGANAMALLTNGKIVLGGTAMAGTANGQRFAVARIQPAGALDTTFGQGGKVTVAFSEGNALVLGTAIAPDGKVLLVGDAGSSMAVARLLGDSAAAGGTPGGTGPGSTGGGGSSTARAPRCGGRRATIVGTSGNDKLKGTRRPT